MKKKIVAILTGMTLVMPNGIFVSASESQAGVESQATLVIIPGLFEPPVRTLRATIPENESHIFR